MKLIGNKLAALTCILSAGMTQADTITAELTEFTAGTPAKAAEVNTNFNQLKSYSDSLQSLISTQSDLIVNLENKIAALEDAQASEGFNIPVMGDGELIGYTNKIPAPLQSTRLIIKSTLGTVKLKGGYENDFILESYNENNPTAEGWNTPNFVDSVCSNPVVAFYTGDELPVLITSVEAIVDQSHLLSAGEPGRTSYVMEAGASISITTPSQSIYRENYEGNCVLVEHLGAGTPIIPIVELNPAVHGIKASYSSISIDGYVLN